MFIFFFFFFNDTATTEIYTLSLHDALPILVGAPGALFPLRRPSLGYRHPKDVEAEKADRKSTRLNSSHVRISYAVFCLKKKTNNKTPLQICSLISHVHCACLSVHSTCCT